MKNIFSLLFFIFWALPSLVFADGVSVTGYAPQSVGVGEQFKLQFTVNERASGITLPDVDGLQVIYGPNTSSSSSHSIINGQVSSQRSTTYTYLAKATKTGQLSIPPAKVVVDGKQYSSNSLAISVVAGQKPSAGSNNASSGSNSRPSYSQSSSSGAPEIVVQQSLVRNSVYEGEGVQLVTKVYTIVDLTSLTDKVDPKLSEFIVVDMSPDQYSFHTEVLDGVQYQAAEIDRKVLIPQKSGKITIDPVEIEFTVRKRVRNGGGFFGGFFDDVQLQSRRVRSKALTLNVKQLPQPKPAGFSGGVGSFKFNMSVNPTELEVDNSMTVKLSVEGSGNLKLLSMPKPQFHQDFECFDPSSKNDFEASASGYHGKRTVEYTLVPRRDGEFEIPQVSFCYFDVAQGKYVTLTQGPYAVNVKKGEDSQVDASGMSVPVPVGRNGENVVYGEGALHYLHNSGTLSLKNDFFVLSPLFWALVLLPLVTLLILFVVNRKRIYDNNNVGLVKSRRANKMARRRLRQAQKFIAANKPEAFYDEVMRALWGYLSDKLTLPLSVLTKDNAKEKMSEHGVSSDACDQFLNLLDECEFARYAPASASNTLNDVYNKAIEVIENIESK